MSNKLKGIVKSGLQTAVVGVVNAAHLSNPERKEVERSEFWPNQGQIASNHPEAGMTDIDFLGRATIASGAGIVAVGALMEAAGSDSLDKLVMASGVGGMVVGLTVSAYERISNR